MNTRPVRRPFTPAEFFLIGVLTLLTVLLLMLVVLIQIAEYEKILGHPLFDDATEAEYAAAAEQIEAHLAETWPDKNLHITSIDYKGNNQFVTTITSDTLIDTHFYLFLTDDIISTHYEEGETESANAYQRIFYQYQDTLRSYMADFEKEGVPDASSVTTVGGIKMYGATEYASASAQPHSCGITEQELIPEKQYALEELCRWGDLHVSVDLPLGECTVERAAEILLDLRTYCDARGIAPHTVSLRLAPVYTAELDQIIDLPEFHYDQIYQENLADRIEAEIACSEIWESTRNAAWQTIRAS